MIVRLLSALLLFQLAAATDAPTPEPQYFRYQRPVSVPHGASGQTCAVLDAAVFAHAAKQSLDDLRLYADGNQEVPFTLTESGSTRTDDEQAEIRNLGTRGGDIVFDLHMPARPYTAVQLNLNAKNFLATAKVSGANGTETPVELGSFALFDLNSQRLSRSTTLPLQESNFHDLHITLHITPSPGAHTESFDPSIVKGATVPPSREAQTLYTSVARVASFNQRGHETVASIHVPAHVPVERFSFEVDPAFHKDFLRTVNITARPDNAQDTASVETISGDISHTTLPGTSTGFVTDESLTHLNVDAVLGADLREGATIEVDVENGDDTPLPIRAAKLEMRQRRICFNADSPVSSYMFRYGDESLKAPVYDYASLFVAAKSPATAALGTEAKNASFRPRRDTRPYSERHPELLWLALIAAVAALGTIAMRSAKKRH